MYVIRVKKKEKIEDETRILDGEDVNNSVVL